jgi:amidohydrolase
MVHESMRLAKERYVVECGIEAEFGAFLAQHERELIEFRRTLHAHPEIGYQEYRTTRQVQARLEAAGLQPAILPKGTGLIVDIGQSDGPVIALRADIDALPIADHKDVPYRSQEPNACHACGHDVHTAILLGVGLLLADLDSKGLLEGRIRLIFQPAEELSGGALDVLEVMATTKMAAVKRIYALHCNPKVDVGRIATKAGPITAGCDKITIQLSGPGGDTGQPHLTADLVYALGKMMGDLPVLLQRRMDSISGVSLVWGRVDAGSAVNVIPSSGVIEGTLRCMNDDAWHAAPDVLRVLVESIADTYNVGAEITHQRIAPPAVNDADSTKILEVATERALGENTVDLAEQSLGGEDFAWYLKGIPGCLARLGTRRPGSDDNLDIHQSNFDVDERAIGVGVKVMTMTALKALES